MNKAQGLALHSQCVYDVAPGELLANVSPSFENKACVYVFELFM